MRGAVRKPSAPRPEGPDDEEPLGKDREGPDESGRSAERGALTRRPVPHEDQRGLTVFGRRTSAPDRPERRSPVVSTGLADRLVERRRAARALRLRQAGVVLAGLLAVTALVWALGFSPLLALRTEEISMTGSDGTVSTASVQQTLEEHAGVSLLRLDVTALGDEVAASLVRVEAASVTRSWPHGLVVALTMRVPVAVRQVDGGYEVLDDEAVVLETVPSAPGGLVTIVPEGGSELTADQVSAVARVVGALNETTRTQVARGSASSTGQVTLTLVNGATVVWGDLSDSALKARVLAVLLSQPATVYDVSSPHSPTTS